MIYDSTKDYPRDLHGYGRDVPHAQWPSQARIAVQFVLNFEEGGENNVLHGDAGSEQFLYSFITENKISYSWMNHLGLIRREIRRKYIFFKRSELHIC